MRFIDYFAICGLGLSHRYLDTEGPFHTTKCLQVEEEEEEEEEEERREADGAEGHGGSAKEWKNKLPALPNLDKHRPLAADLVDRYPSQDLPGFALPGMLPACVLPYGVRVYSRPCDPLQPDSMPSSYSVILTDNKGDKVYVAVLALREQVGPTLGKLHRLSPKRYADKCMCIVSHLPLFNKFEEVLKALYFLLRSGKPLVKPFWDIVADIVDVRLPLLYPTADAKLLHIPHVNVTTSLPNLASPRPGHVSYLPLVETLGVDAIIRLWTGVLLERKILLVGPNRKFLTLVAEALTSLTWPLTWASIYVPVLPLEALNALDAPVSFLYGVASDMVDLYVGDLDDVLIADFDNGHVKLGGECGDEVVVDEDGPLESPHKLNRGRSANASQWGFIFKAFSTTVQEEQQLQDGGEGELAHVDAEAQLPRACVAEEEESAKRSDGVPKLPRAVAKALKEALLRLTRPATFSLERVSSVQQAPGEPGGAACFSRWGPDEDATFQLVFARAMASLLEGYRMHLSDTADLTMHGSDVSMDDIFDKEEFLRVKKQELGATGKALVQEIMCTQAWPQFIVDRIVHGPSATAFDAVESICRVPGTLKSTQALHVSAVHSWPRSASEYPAGLMSEGGGRGMGVGGEARVVPLEEPWGGVHIPESSASTIVQRRKEDAAKKLRMATILQKHQEEIKELGYLAVIEQSLDSLAKDTPSDATLESVRTLLEAKLDDLFFVKCFIQSLEERFLSTVGKDEASDVGGVGKRELFKRLVSALLRALGELGHWLECSSAALAVAGPVGGKKDQLLSESPLCGVLAKVASRFHFQLKELKALGLWRKRTFWVALQRLKQNQLSEVKEENGEGESVEAAGGGVEVREAEKYKMELETQILKEVVQVMVEVGLTEGEVGEFVELLAKDLSSEHQILLRYEFLRLRVAQNAVAKLFVNMLQTKVVPSNSAAKWRRIASLTTSLAPSASIP